MRTLSWPRLLAALFALLMLQQASAQSRWYTLEVVIFERTSDAGLTEEYWPENVDSARHGLALSSQTDTGVRVLSAGSSEARAIARLRRGQLAYGGMVNRLTSSGQYRALVHTGWRQPGLTKSEALPVRVTGTASSGLGGAVNGTLRLYRSRYLHIEADLVYSRPGSGQTEYFALRESRRMRSGELHYLDHPLFGVLLRATPYQAPGGEYVPSRDAPRKQAPAAKPSASPTVPSASKSAS